MVFFPENYEIPSSSSNFTKFEKGDTKIRILTSPVLGWVYWTIEPNRPVRLAMDKKPVVQPVNAKLDENGRFRPRHFWLLKIWNYNTQQIEVCEITQKNIQGAIAAFSKESDYGHPNGYDIVINRVGEGYETKYQVMPKVPKEVSAEIKQADKEVEVNLNAVFTGDNPFEVSLVVEEKREIELN